MTLEAYQPAAYELSLGLFDAPELFPLTKEIYIDRKPATYAFAGVHGIAMWDGALEGAADPQRDGYPAGIA